MGRQSAFQQTWLTREVDLVAVGEWCTADPSDKYKAKCLTCPPGLQPFGLIFSIKEGFSAVEKHAKSAKHREKFQLGVAEDNNEGFEQINIQDALKNQEDLNKRQITENKQLLEGQILFSNFVHTHGLPSSSFACFGNLAHRIFPDSKIAKRWSGTRDGMRKTKGDYFLTHGVYKHHQQNII